METEPIRDYFYNLADLIGERLQPGEHFTCLLRGEDSDFVRLNHNRMRQAGHVRQTELSVDLIKDRRHSSGHFNVTGDPDQDRKVLEQTLQNLRSQRNLLCDDPYLLVAKDVHNSETMQTAPALDAKDIVTQIMAIADGLDLVGIWASGSQFEGFANAFGQRNWHSADSFSFDWSCYRRGEKAVKANYAGIEWDVDTFAHRLSNMRAQLKLLERPFHSLKPGRYRTYLAPDALKELLDLLGWGGFGLKSHRTLQTPLLKMTQQERSLHPDIQICENRSGGPIPEFTPEGFFKPKRIVLVQDGEYHDCLVSSRSSVEYSTPVNASRETPDSLSLAPGSVAESEILERLDTGLYIGNLWYSNFSNRNDCRITGMTRYACFWVDQGEIAAPINVMRFDDTLYNILGDKLLGLTDKQQVFMSPSTYQRRSASSMSLPGALVEDFKLTL